MSCELRFMSYELRAVLRVSYEFSELKIVSSEKSEFRGLWAMGNGLLVTRSEILGMSFLRCMLERMRYE